MLSIISDVFAACSGGYINQTASNYILPYPVGRSYVVGQGNCTDGSHEIGLDQAYAYDFDMPIGSDITAAKPGTVVAVEEQYIDGNGTAGHENFIIVEHADGKVSGYYHLTKNGVMLEIGDQVAQGQVIALSGNTGDSTEPHLHFEVLECRECDTVPINFYNTRFHDNGLIEGQSYRAESFQNLGNNRDSVVTQLFLLLLE